MVSEENGIDFILTHLEEPLFPRTISTYRSEGRQFEVFSKEEMIKAFEQSDFLDCRVNAYPSYTEYKGINRQPPNFLFIDLDKDIVETARAHRLALTNTLRNIKEKLSEAYPTVLWSGNGYHIYQPIEAFVLEEEEVKIIQRWDGYRPKINLLLRSFHAYLVDQRIKELQRQKEQIKKYRQKHGDVNDIKWIEILLETPISDYRKNAINLILAPYLINIKKLPYTD